MASCSACGITTFGGPKVGKFEFCSQRCASYAGLLTTAESLPEDLVNEHVAAIFNGNCPKCGGQGPVDIRCNHKIRSMLVLCQWSTEAPICCPACGRKGQINALIHCAVLGWWGFPNGIIRTPFQIAKNLSELKKNGATEPSEALKRHVRLQLAAQPTPGVQSPYLRVPGAA